MKDNLNLIVKNLAKSISVLIVDDDEFTLEIYKAVFGELFFRTFTASNGQEAYDLWLDQNKKIDLIVTDILMPKLDGFKLIDKIREKSKTQHIIVLTSIDDLNEMREIINLGVDGIILKPFEEEKVLPVLERVLEVIKAKKVMKRQIFQLKLLSQEKVALKTSSKNIEEKDEVLKKKNNLSKKYKIRNTVKGEDALSLNETIDYKDTVNVDTLIDLLNEYESLLVKIEAKPINEVIDNLISSTEVIEMLVELMSRIGSFNVAVDAGHNIVDFIKNIDVDKLKDTNKKELFFDVYLSMFQDIENWLKVVFINKEASNSNYFDASFANTCLELEAIFANNEDDSDLEFF